MQTREERIAELAKQYIKSGTLEVDLLSEACLRALDAQQEPTFENVWLALMLDQYEIDLLIKNFEHTVWFGGLQKLAQDSPTKGLKGSNVLVYTIAGRAMITLQGNGCQVSLLTEEDAETPKMGLRSIVGTVGQAVGLMRNAIERQESENLEIVSDPDVGLGF